MLKKNDCNYRSGKICGIYGIRNAITGAWYIGQSVDIKKRRTKHLHELRKGVHYNLYLQRSFNLCGEEEFEFHILEEVNSDMLDIREIAWISYHQSMSRDRGYNLESGGLANRTQSPESVEKRRKSNIGKKMSEEAKKRISDANRIIYSDPERRKNLSDRAKVRTYSKETREKMRKAKLGKKWSQESKDKKSAYMKVAWATGKMKRSQAAKNPQEAALNR